MDKVKVRLKSSKEMKAHKARAKKELEREDEEVEVDEVLYGKIDGDVVESAPKIG